MTKLTCYGLHWARLTLPVEDGEVKSTNPEWLKWFAENKIQQKHGVKMPLRKVEVNG